MNNFKTTQEEFIQKCIEIHGTEKYDFSETIFNGMKKKVTVKCKKHNEYFEKTATYFLKPGNHCPLCETEIKHNTQESFIAKCKEIHGDKYNYDNTIFTKASEKIEIYCNTHKGFFTQIARDHKEGHGCNYCYGNKVKDTESFINESSKLYPDKGDYTLTVYKNNTTPVTIRCKEHNKEFKITPKDHSRRFGCYKCSSSKTLNKEQYLEEAIEKHGDLYEYDLSNYVNSSSKIKIKCKIHGWVETTAGPHIYGKGRKCSKCNGPLDTEEFIRRSKLKHGEDKFGYDKVNYKNSGTEIEIYCKEGGHYFTQKASYNLDGSGCNICSGNARKTQEQFIEEANKFHNNFYNYDKTVYVNNRSMITVHCPIHGDYTVQAKSHLSVKCRKCDKSSTSFPEQYLFLSLKKSFPDANISNGIKILGKEIDIYFNDIKLGIEYDGGIYHRGKIDKDNDKNLYFKNNGIEIIRIREKELPELEHCINIKREHRDSRNIEELNTVIDKIMVILNDKFKTNNEVYYPTEDDVKYIIDNSFLRYVSYEEYYKWFHEIPNDIRPNTQITFTQFIKTYPKEKGYPSSPANIYKNNGWINWGTFFTPPII